MKSLDKLTAEKNKLVEKLTEEESKFQLYHQTIEQQKSQLESFVDIRDDEIESLKKKLAEKVDVIEELEQRIENLDETVNCLREQSDEVTKLFAASQNLK